MTQFENGAIIDAYRIIGTLGSGGMGQVYRVEHTLTRRQDAMKVLAGGRHSAGGQAQRFLREIQLQASLNHPNIAAVHHALWLDEDLVMIMELVEGATLRSVLQAGRLPVATALSYARQALLALQHAHEHGVVHRDVTPANILIAGGGLVKLTDFGLAKAPRDMRLTQSGAVTGSLYYMSPEQVRGSPTLDERTDIYSLGVVLYEMCTGRRPFEAGDPFSLMLAHVQQAPQSPLEIDPSIRPELSQILLTALAKEPDRRFSSANAFRERLEALPQNVSAGSAQSWPRPRVLRYSASALVCATLLIGVEKPEPPAAPTTAVEPPLPRPADIRGEPAIEQHPESRAARIRKEPVSQEQLAPRPADTVEESASQEQLAPPPVDTGQESTNDKRPHRRSWISRAFGKVVHPRSKRDSDAKR